jgi:hypothetical protein
VRDVRICLAALLLAVLAVLPAYAQVQPDSDAGQAGMAAPAKELTPDERLQLLEKRVEELEKGRLGDIPILRRLRVGFELELEWLFAQRDLAGSTRRGQLDKFTIDVDAEFDEHISVVAQGRFEAEEAWVKTTYCQVDGLPFGQRLRFGLDERIFKPVRRTESYPLIGTAFWRTHDFGLSYRIRVPDSNDTHCYLKLAAANGLSLDSREPGEQEQYYLVCDRKASAVSGSGENEEYSACVGFRLDGGGGQWLDVSLFGLVSRLDDGDAAFLNLHINPVDPALGEAKRGDSKWRRGAAVSARWLALRFQGMYVKARDADLFREGFYAQCSYCIDTKLEWLKSAELLVRTGHILLDMKKSIAQPMSWDRRELTFAALLEVRKGVVAKLEYTIHGEDPGPGVKQVRNNEFVFQVELSF